LFSKSISTISCERFVSLPIGQSDDFSDVGGGFLPQQGDIDDCPNTRDLAQGQDLLVIGLLCWSDARTAADPMSERGEGGERTFAPLYPVIIHVIPRR
jgi:hypothetical protein